jgi:hypothetical protein
MRHFHLKRNQYFNPVVNVDKIWTLVSEQTKQNAEKNKDKVPVIDVTKAVIIYYISKTNRVTSKYSERELFLRFQLLLRQRLSQRLLRRELRKPVVSAFLPLEVSDMMDKTNKARLELLCDL